MNRCSARVDDTRAKADAAKQAHEFAEAQLQIAETELLHASSMYDQVKAMAPPTPPTVRLSDDDVHMRGPGAVPASPPTARAASLPPDGASAAPATPVAPSPNSNVHPAPAPSVIAAMQQEQAKFAAGQAALSQQMQALTSQLGPVLSHIQAAAQAEAARIPVEVTTTPKKTPYIPPPTGQRTLAQTVGGATRRSMSAIPTHRGPGSVRRSPSRTRSGPYTPPDAAKGSEDRSRTPDKEPKEPSRPSSATLNLDEEREAARRASFPGGTVKEPTVPPSPGSLSPEK